ncbi:MAG: hypothetical protein ACLPHP_21510 [Candidatus Sulfotelmatobacter sp.]
MHVKADHPTDEKKERRKELSTYADGITAFSTAQLIGFVLLMTHGDCFTQNVLSGLSFAITIGVTANLFYIGLVVLCQSSIAMTVSHDSILKTVRLGILSLNLAATILILLGINHGWHDPKHPFVIDCHGTLAPGIH